MRQTTLSLVILSFLLGFIAPACGFMWGGQYSVIEICTDKGIEQRIVANNETPTPLNHKTTSDKCEFCFQNMNLSDYLIDTQNTIILRFNLETKIRFTHQRNIADSFSALHLARGPPTLI